MSTALATLALAIFFALPAFLIVLGLVHGFLALVGIVRNIRSAERPVSWTIQS